MQFLESAIVIIYCISLMFIFIFSLGQLHLTYLYLKGRKQKPVKQSKLNRFPKVTIQLPIYNELYVVKRLINAVCNLEYPVDKLEIQVLDDSNDQTSDLIENLVKEWKLNGIDIKQIKRNHRVGFKAGALQAGLQKSKGDFIAIFDADFIPEPDFLSKTLPHFNLEIGMVQVKWAHLNEDYSLLTRVQAFGLNAHFSIEQSGRNFAKSFINFNGTAGIWRKKCIVDAGGWSADTLTEDLDLSYRAQISGWKFKYLEHVKAPAELPVVMSAIKSQQFRWNKGAAETARKNLGKVLKSKIGLVNKIHALFHLHNSSVFIFLLIASLLSLPILFIKLKNSELENLFIIGNFFLLGFLSIGIFYWVASFVNNPERPLFHFLKKFPVFLTIMMGLSLHNSIAVLQGWLGKKTRFVRTPKFNVFNSGDSWKGNKYIDSKINFTTLLEGLLSIYFLLALVVGISIGDTGLFLFHLILSLGFFLVFYHSLRTGVHA